jgi:predicted signal transduction protein with EAL and GGDEF domain
MEKQFQTRDFIDDRLYSFRWKILFPFILLIAILTSVGSVFSFLEGSMVVYRYTPFIALVSSWLSLFIYILFTILSGVFGLMGGIFIFPFLFYIQLFVILFFFSDLPLFDLISSVVIYVMIFGIGVVSLVAYLYNRKFYQLVSSLAFTVNQNSVLDTLSMADGLTGLLNRRKLDEVLELEFAKAKAFGNSLSCMMVDIDNFKKINDE